MLKSIEALYRNGKIEFLETPPGISDTKVIVTFLSDEKIDLGNREISTTQAADLRARLNTIAPDWDRPEMNVYDEL